MPVTINGDGSISGLSVGGLGSGVVNQATLANNAVNASKIDLTDNYAFTGTFSTPNGYNLLTTRNDSSNTDYTGDILIFDLNPYLSTYDVFYFDVKYYNTDTVGSVHTYFHFRDVSGNTCDIRYVSNGLSQDGSTATPHNGSGDYFRPAFATQYATTATYQFHLYNSTVSDTSLDATITGQSSWYREGSGVSAANFAAQASGDDKFRYFYLNSDTVSSGAQRTARVHARLYGVS